MDDKPATTDDLRRIERAARDRIEYLLWLAAKLEQTTDGAIRKEAARQIRQLVEDVT